jgi:formylglycine-generating enzyme required for sulfatase activity
MGMRSTLSGGLAACGLWVASCALAGFEKVDEGAGGSGGGAAPTCGGQTLPVDGDRPSCDKGAHSSCGLGWDQWCCETICLPGGEFDRDNDTSLHATLSPVFLDKYEVTVGRFRQFVESEDIYRPSAPKVGDGNHHQFTGWQAAWDEELPLDVSELPSHVGEGVDYCTWGLGNDDASMNCVSWYLALRFCLWDGGRLPTEAEWSYAATGGSQQREYPWGNDAPQLPDWALIGCNTTTPTSECQAGEAVHRPGSFPLEAAGFFGHADLASNLIEWTLDGVGLDNGMPDQSMPTPCDDCVDVHDSSGRAVRGAGFIDPPSKLLNANRASWDPQAQPFDLGIRCARDPESIP